MEESSEKDWSPGPSVPYCRHVMALWLKTFYISRLVRLRLIDTCQRLTPNAALLYTTNRLPFALLSRASLLHTVTLSCPHTGFRYIRVFGRHGLWPEDSLEWPLLLVE